MYPRRASPIIPSLHRAHRISLVSIGDWYPERNLFQLLIALNSGAWRTVRIWIYNRLDPEFQGLALHCCCARTRSHERPTLRDPLSCYVLVLSEP